MKDDEGQRIRVIDPDFQCRENVILQGFLSAIETFTDEQLSAVKKLTKLPFGGLFIEGVPGSGKTHVAAWIMASIMGPSKDDTNVSTYQQPVAGEDPEDDGELDDGHFLDDVEDGNGDVEFDIEPELIEIVAAIEQEPLTEAKKPGSQEAKLKPDKWNSLYDIPRLACGPSRQQLETIVAELRDVAEADRSKHLMQRILSIYNANVDLKNAQNLGLGKDRQPQEKPRNVPTNPKAMIIANQNTNADDLPKI